MQRLALDFGPDSGIYRLFCDSCSKPVTTCYQSSNGQYCSKACLDRSDHDKVKLPVVQEVKTPDPSKVKTGDPEKVKLAQVSKVKIAPFAKVKITGGEKVKTDQAPAHASKVKPRERKRIRRRAAIRRMRSEIVAGAGREPTIAEVQSRLKPLGLNASVRTVWKDMKNTTE